MDGNPVQHSEEDLAQMIQLNFHLLAENMAALAKRNPDKATVRLRTTVNRLVVGCVVKAMEE